MKIKDSTYDVDELVSNLDFKSNMLKEVNEKLSLTNYQIDVLKRNDINPENYNSLREIIYLAEDAYEDTLDEELELVLDQLSERNYYENTNK